MEVLEKSDPLIRDALQTILERGDFIPSLPDVAPRGVPIGGVPAPIETDPAVVADLVARSQSSIAALKRDIPLTQSVPHNVTSEMGLALLDVADVIRPHQGGCWCGGRIRASAGRRKTREIALRLGHRSSCDS